MSPNKCEDDFEKDQGEELKDTKKWNIREEEKIDFIDLVMGNKTIPSLNGLYFLKIDGELNCRVNMRKNKESIPVWRLQDLRSPD